MTTRVMFYVQHLLGVGHLKRASLIAGAMVDAGLEVSVVLGGVDVPGIDFRGCARIRLPAVRATDETFTCLVGEDGQPIDDAVRDARAARLLAEFDAIQPDVLLIEQFPFGRRQFRFELMPLLEAARTSRPRARVVCSLRDILVPKSKPERHREMVALAKAWFDCVLVHGDPKLVRLESTFPETAEIMPRVRYTGYVVDHTHAGAIRDSRAGSGEVIVSAGGGAVGAPLLRAAMTARPRSRLAAHPWRLITGPNLPDKDFDELAWDPPSGMVVERWRNDMPALFRNGVLSISQGGYNTIMDILQAKARAVVVPFAAGGQTEQTCRVRLLAEHGAVTMVDPGTLSPDTLAEAVGCALDAEPGRTAINMNGAKESARVIASLRDETAPLRGA